MSVRLDLGAEGAWQWSTLQGVEVVLVEGVGGRRRSIHAAASVLHLCTCFYRGLKNYTAAAAPIRNHPKSTMAWLAHGFNIHAARCSGPTKKLRKRPP